MKNLSIDIETYSGYDLSKCGVYKYAESPDFEIILFGYSIDGGEVYIVDFSAGETLPPEILDALTDDNVQKWAFNANFEITCIQNAIKKIASPTDWRVRRCIRSDCPAARPTGCRPWSCGFPATAALPTNSASPNSPR